MIDSRRKIGRGAYASLGKPPTIDFGIMRQVVVKRYGIERVGYLDSICSNNYLIAVIFPSEGKYPELGFYSKSEIVDIEL